MSEASDEASKPKNRTERAQNELLAQAVTEAMERRGWSLRAAELYSGVGLSTWDRLRKGLSVDTDALIKAAYAAAETGKEVETATHWLQLAGKYTLVELLEAVARAARQVPEERTSVVEIEPGKTVRILAVGSKPGSEFEATPENLAVIADMMGLVKKAEQQH